MGGKNKLNVQVKSKATKAPEPIESQAIEENLESVDQNYGGEREDNNISVYLWLLVFSVLMFTFPFLTFYGVRSWLNESFDFTTFETNCFSVLASVLVVNFIICLYVYKAFCEGTTNSGSNRPVQAAIQETEEIKKAN